MSNSFDLVKRMINGISILVVTRGRVKLLEDLFCSLDVARTNCELPTELVVFDNSDEDDAKEIETITRAHNGRYFFSQSSVAIKRNMCAQEAKYELLFFCDSDCIVTPNILNEHIGCYSDKKIGATCGPVILEGEQNPFVKLMSETAWCDAFTQPLKHDELQWGATANFTVLKKAFDEAGGFNERFPNKPGGEDVDIGFKVCDAGYVIKSAPNAVVYHSNQTWLRMKDVSSRLYSYGKSNVLVALEHRDRLIPEMNWLVIWFLLFVGATLISIFTSPFALLLPAVFPIVYFAIGLISELILSGKNIKQILTLELLSIIEKWGSIVGCFKYKTLLPLHKQVLYSKYQEHGTYPVNQRKYATIAGSLLISCLLALIMI